MYIISRNVFKFENNQIEFEIRTCVKEIVSTLVNEYTRLSVLSWNVAEVSTKSHFTFLVFTWLVVDKKMMLCPSCGVLYKLENNSVCLFNLIGWAYYFNFVRLFLSANLLYSIIYFLTAGNRLELINFDCFCY